MRRTIVALACLIAVSVGSLAGAAVVLAQGTSTSAGDQQYVDPLTSTTGTSHSSGSSSSGSASSSSSGSSSSSSGSSSSTSNTTLAQTPSSTAGGTSSGSTTTATQASAGGKTLPFTGMNVGACLALGVGLLGTGVALRRVVRRT